MRTVAPLLMILAALLTACTDPLRGDLHIGEPVPACRLTAWWDFCYRPNPSPEDLEMREAWKCPKSTRPSC